MTSERNESVTTPRGWTVAGYLLMFVLSGSWLGGGKNEDIEEGFVAGAGLDDPT